MESALRAYRSVWSVIAGGALAIGLVIAIQTLTTAELVCIAIATVLIGDACALSYATVDSLRTRYVLLAGPVLTLVTLAAVGLCTVFEGPGLMVITVLGLSSPWVIRLLFKVPRFAAEPEVQAGSTVPMAPGGARVVPVDEWLPQVPLPDLADQNLIDPLEVADVLDDLELCNAWHNSYVALQRAESPRDKMQIVALRKLYLDSFERRDPQAFRAWMASGGRAAGDLSRYLLHE